MSFAKEIKSLINIEVYEIGTADTEKSVQYHYGKAMAYAGLLCTHCRQYIEYMHYLREIDENMQFRYSRGFAKNGNPA